LGVNLREKSSWYKTELTKTNGSHFKTKFIGTKKFSGSEVHYGHLTEILGFNVYNCFPIVSDLKDTDRKNSLAGLDDKTAISNDVTGNEFMTVS